MVKTWKANFNWKNITERIYKLSYKIKTIINEVIDV